MINKSGICYIRTGYKKLLGKVRKFGKSVLTLIHPPSQCGCCVQQLESEQAFSSELNNLKEISGHTMVNHIYDDIEKALVEDDETLIKASENAEKELQDIVKRARRSISLPYLLLVSKRRIWSKSNMRLWTHCKSISKEQ